MFQHRWKHRVSNLALVIILCLSLVASAVALVDQAAAAQTSPNQPTLNSPANAATGVPIAPVLSVNVTDPDSDDMDVTFWGREAIGNFTFENLGTVSEVPSGDTASIEWPGRTQGTTYQWYVTVSDGSPTTIGPQWSFSTEAPLTVAFSSATHSAAENAGNATITVNLSSASAQTITVNYATSNGNATAGSDYTAASGTLTFNAGDVTKTFDITILDDATFEGDETVNLALNSPVNATLGSPDTAVLTITDNDAQPSGGGGGSSGGGGIIAPTSTPRQTPTPAPTPTSAPTPGPTPGPTPTSGLMPTPAPTPELAQFSLRNLVVNPSTVTVGEEVAISVDVLNTGEVQRIYTATLKINNYLEETKEITLADGASVTVNFTVIEDVAAKYQVEIGELTGEFTVSAPPIEVSWSLISVIIGVVLTVGMAAIVLLPRREKTS